MVAHFGEKLLQRFWRFVWLNGCLFSSKSFAILYLGVPVASSLCGYRCFYQPKNDLHPSLVKMTPLHAFHVLILGSTGSELSYTQTCARHGQLPITAYFPSADTVRMVFEVHC